MRPRYESVAKEVKDMMTKAEFLVERLDTLEKAKMCPDYNMLKKDCGCGRK